ncbi:MAG: bifunctional UDP-sugar hydrolase/5'-nucleotidase [Bacteroidales bacterium]
MQIKRMKFLPIVAIGLAALVGCNQKPKEAELTLLYTTDMHGAILPFDFNKNKSAATSLANVATYVKQEREKNKDGVLLLDGGDFLQGQPSIYYSNFEDTISEHIQSRVMEYIGYDAATVGNHDIEPGESVYSRVQNDFDFPWLAANAIDTRTGKPFFEPYAIFERNGIKVAVLGMITPNIHAWLPKYLWENIEFRDMVETAKEWVPYIQQKEKPDLLIGLFHSGSDYTVGGNTLETVKNENGAIPAVMKVDGFDIALLGHDHQEKAEIITNDFGNDVVVLDAQTGARYVGRADIKLRKKGDKYEKEITPSLVEMKNVPQDKAFVEAFSKDVDQINQYVDAEIGTLTDTLRSGDALYGPSEFMDLIHNAQLQATGADISFAGVLSTDAVIPTGKLTMRNLFTLYKYENLLYTMSLTGQEIQKFLEYGYDRQYNQMKSPSDHLLNFKKDEKGNLMKNPRFGYSFVTPSFNFTSAAGIKYTVDVTKPAGERVTILSMSDGKPFDMNKEYKVAVNSYQASGGGGFFFEGLGFTKEQTDARVINASKNDVRKYIADYIREQKVITPTSRGDWKVIPEKYFEAGKATDMKLMNSTK